MSQSMGTIMPLMYGFFALSFSVGLSIYFIASNVIGIVQYALMGKADFRRIFGLSSNQADYRPEKIDGKATSSIKPTQTRAAETKRSPGLNRESPKPKASNNGTSKSAQKVDKAK